jgi:O-antigen/teichoic acid export membrane protein
MSAKERSSSVYYLSWTALSQVLNAGTNVLLMVLLARSLPIRDFGTVAMGLVFLPLLVAGLRGLVFEPAVVHSTLSRNTCKRVLRDAGIAGVAAAGFLFLIVLAVDGPLIVAGLLAVGAIATTLEEASRWILFGLDRPRTGAGLDVIWTVVQVSVLLMAWSSSTVAAGAWCAGALCAAVTGWRAVRLHAPTIEESRPARVWQWGLEYMFAAGALNLAVLLAPITGGIHVAAGLRGAMTLLGATSVILGGAQQAVAGRLRRMQEADMRRSGRMVGLGLGAVVALSCLPLLAIDLQIGRELLGDSWDATRIVLPALVLQRVATAVTCGPAFVLRKVPDHTVGVWWRLALTVATLVGVLVAASFGSDRGAAWALAVGAAASVPIWFRMLERATRGRGAPERQTVTHG